MSLTYAGELHRERQPRPKPRHARPLRWRGRAWNLAKALGGLGGLLQPYEAAHR